MTHAPDVDLPLEEVFAPWAVAQKEVECLIREVPPPIALLRQAGRLRPDAARRIADWYAGPATAPEWAIRASYQALERETAQLWQAITGDAGLGIRVGFTYGEDDPYANASELCADLRENRSMLLRTIACDPPHPLLGGEEGGIVDRLRVVHDVFGHAALGLGFDLQSEYATWLQCRTLYSMQARGAAFTELVGAVTTYVMTGRKPALRADLPPAALSCP